MAAVLRASVLLLVYVVLQFSGGYSEELYPNLRCYPGYREDLYDNDYLKRIHDSCSTEEKRNSWLTPKFDTMYHTFRGCLMGLYFLVLPCTEEGKLKIEYDIHGALLDILVNDNWRYRQGKSKEDGDYIELMWYRTEAIEGKVINACNATAEEVIAMPEVEWTKIFDCIDDIIVCKS